MSHLTSTTARVEITTITGGTTFTEHWHGTYVEARGIVARHVHLNGLSRTTYGDAAPLYRDGVRIGHYTITRS